MLPFFREIFGPYLQRRFAIILSVIIPSLKEHPWVAEKLSTKTADTVVKTGKTVAKVMGKARSIRDNIWSYIFLACILLALAFITSVLWLVERRAATLDAIDEARLVTVELPDVDRIDPAFNGKMVHAMGFADTKSTLSDPEFGVVTTAIMLIRIVDNYQWVRMYSSEEKDYVYTRQWISYSVDSSDFDEPYRGKNFVLTNFYDKVFCAGDVTLGAYKLSPSVVDSMPASVPLVVELPSDVVADLNEKMGQFGVGEGYIHIRGNIVYLGSSPDEPSVGDVRVSFYEAPPGNVSILARVAGDAFEPFTVSNGATFCRVSAGTVGMDKMYDDAVSDLQSRFEVWGMRDLITEDDIGDMAEFRLVVAGMIWLILWVFTPNFGAIPFFRTMVEAGRFWFPLLLAPAWILLAVASAWLTFRPISGALLLAAGIVFSFVVIKFLNNKGKKRMEKDNGWKKTENF